jgi:cell division protein FtsL
MAKAQAGPVLVVIFILGIIIEIYYVLSFLSSQRTLSDILEKTFFTGVITAILIIIAIVLLKQSAITERLRSASLSSGPRTEKQVRKDLNRTYSDLGALKILLKDDLLDKKTYEKRKKRLDEDVIRLKAEMKSAEPSAD